MGDLFTAQPADYISRNKDSSGGEASTFMLAKL